MKTILKLLATTLLLLAPVAARAQITFITNNNTITITGYTGTDGFLFIPSSINGYPVTAIAPNAFFNSSVLTSVTLPNTLLTIGYSAFFACRSLAAVTIPNSVTNIGDTAFGLCPGFTTANIPAGVITLGHQVFRACPNLTTFNVDPANPSYSNDPNGVLFDKTKSLLVEYPAGKPLGPYTIPNGVTSIADFAFYDCELLTGITIPAGVTNIGPSTFISCIRLPSLTIPAGVTSIPEQMCFACQSLSSITLPDTVTSIGNYAFYDVPHISSVTLPANLAILGAYSFDECSLTNVTIPATVTNIGAGAFEYNGALTNIYFLGNAPDLGGTIFDSINSSAVVTFLGTTFGWGPKFSGVPTVSIPPIPYGYTTNNSTVTITSYLGNDTALVIPQKIVQLPVVNIGDAVFANRINLTSVTIPNGVTNLGLNVFSNDYNLVSISIPDSVVRIGTGAFTLCSRLQSITLPPNITSIGDYTFLECSALTSIVIPKKVTSIGMLVFRDCSQLQYFYFQGNAPSVGAGAFLDMADNPVGYYVYGTTGWGPNLPGLLTVLLNPPIDSGSIKVGANGFSFAITGHEHQTVIVQASTDYVNWVPIQTNVLNGTPINFADPQWANYPNRSYRLSYGP